MRKRPEDAEEREEYDERKIRMPQAFDLFSELPQTPLTSHTSQLGQKTREQIKAEEALKKKRLFALGVFIVILGILVALALT